MTTNQHTQGLPVTSVHVAVSVFEPPAAARLRTRILFGWIWLSAIAVAAVCVAQPPPIPLAPVPPRPAPKSPAAAAPTTPVKPTMGAPATTTAPTPAVSPTRSTAGKRGKMETKTLELTTKDGVPLNAFYFPSDRGKEAIPVIVVHEWKGQASPYLPLVESLWKVGCAVIVPELRGHGASRHYMVGSTKKDFDIERMGKSDVAKMIAGDLETVKKFLRDENNLENLNLNALVIVGVREGAVLAAQWAVNDLNFPSVGAIKQGQDVKALVLVSPERIVEGFTLDATLKDRYLWQLPFFIIVGAGSPQFEDTEKFYRKLEQIKKKAGRGSAEGLTLSLERTSLDGPALLNQAPGAIDKVTAFVKSELVDKSSKIPWVKRE